MAYGEMTPVKLDRTLFGTCTRSVRFGLYVRQITTDLVRTLFTLLTEPRRFIDV